MSDPTPRHAAAAPWSADHLRLHRALRRRPELLPAGESLLVAVSGGQDSMALVALLRDLRRLHGWTLHLWHGDHGWRPASGDQARQLQAWAEAEGLPFSLARWEQPVQDEASARSWRYASLLARATALGATRVVTGHTASDRAETFLFNLARGSHRRGLGSLRPLRPLGGTVMLARPLLGFGRADTARLCGALQLPVWPDAGNSDPRFSRNRLRGEVLPVLEALHPGAERRLAALAAGLAEEEEAQTELGDLALSGLLGLPPAIDQSRAGRATARLPDRLPLAALQRLQRANQAVLLQRWLERRTGRRLQRRSLDLLLDRLGRDGGWGPLHLPDGWRLREQRSTLLLTRESSGPCDDGQS
ncbi:tRNA(Ile)-lysidine synthase [Cyanobium sp. PCC 7001]|uniref:tRNA lysidine(34) synthetase TilS n=1 Tax=Cyanobium sp. PCC 7001 TaxID=180281 RepID=UPI0001804F3D|nr:tRNA lysidine(34) synthetase TilS [Cyanobium sp. PCC 7001]EDY39059.1 tRNA(Ile)-lysidine synthase [Cyanobium sp. PCC 7001]